MRFETHQQAVIDQALRDAATRMPLDANDIKDWAKRVASACDPDTPGDRMLLESQYRATFQQALARHAAEVGPGHVFPDYDTASSPVLERIARERLDRGH